VAANAIPATTATTTTTTTAAAAAAATTTPTATTTAAAATATATAATTTAFWRRADAWRFEVNVTTATTGVFCHQSAIPFIVSVRDSVTAVYTLISTLSF
jgi:hypothetical protein